MTLIWNYIINMKFFQLYSINRLSLIIKKITQKLISYVIIISEIIRRFDDMQNKIDHEPTFWQKAGRYILESLKLFVKYIFGKTIASALLGLIAYAVFSLIGIQHAVILAIIIGISNLIPIAGPIAAAIICAIIVVFQQPIYSLYVFITIVVLQQLDQWIITPIFVGRSVSLPPILIIIVVFLGGLIWGIPGLLLAVPVSAMVRLYYVMFVKKSESGI